METTGSTLVDDQEWRKYDTRGHTNKKKIKEKKSTIYQPDICYVNRDGIERTLQVIIPETAQDPDKKYPAILHVQGSAWKKQDVYKRVGVMEELSKRILFFCEIAPFPAPVEDAKTGIRFLRKNAEQFKIDPENIFLISVCIYHSIYGRYGLYGYRCIQRIFLVNEIYMVSAV